MEAVKDKEKLAADQEHVATYPQTIEKLAELTRPIAQEEILRLFGTELGAKIDTARAEVDRKAAIAAAAAQVVAESGMRRQKRPPMDMEQQGEAFRCLMMRCLARPDLAVPDRTLDADGLITQALTSISGSAGGYFLPDEFINEVEKKAAEPVQIWPLLTKRPTKSRTVKKPEVTTYITPNTGTSANVNSATTATEITVTEPVFSQIEWNLEDMDARMPVKLDLIEESPINVYQELIDLCADGFAVKREYFPLRGRGHTTYQEPAGLCDTIGGITSVATSGADSVTEILDFVAQIPLRYRMRATLVMDCQTLFQVCSTLATNVRAAQFLVDKLPKMVESEHMNEGKILGGDFSRYVVYHIRLMQVITSIAAERKTQEIVVTETWTGQPTITDAFRIGTGASY